MSGNMDQVGGSRGDEKWSGFGGTLNVQLTGWL